MKQIEVRYVAHVTTLTGLLVESAGASGRPYRTEASSIRELVEELDARYPGFFELFVNPGSGKLNLNAMIYYGDPGKVPISVIDLDHPIRDGGTVTFW